MRHAPRLLAALAVTLALGSAAADDEVQRDATASGLVEYVEVNVTALPTSNTIATKLPTSMQLTPANVGSVGEALIREQDAIVLGDALVNVSSLNVQAGPAVHDFFSIRGFDSLNSALVLVDGASVPEATFYPMYNIAGVEVLKGPGGFLYGTNPLAGVVNMVRKQPLPGDFAILSASLGSLSTADGSLDWNRASRDGALSFRLNALWHDTDGYRDGRENRIAAINPSFTWQLSGRSRLNFNLEYVDAEFAPDAGLPLVSGATGALELPEVPRRRSYQSPVDFSDQQIARFEVNFETKLGERITLRNKAYFRRLDWDSDGTLFNGTLPAPAPPLALRTLTTLDDRQRIAGNQLEAILEARGWGVTHRLLAGLELARYTDDYDIGVLPPQGALTPSPFDICDPSQFGMACIDVYDPVETFAGSSAAALPFAAGDARSTVVAPYVVDQIEVSRRVQLLLGARYDDIEVKDDVSGIRRDDGEVSPSLGVVVVPAAGLTLYANAGRSHAPASLRVQGDFEPEQSTQLEVGARRTFLGGRLHTTLAAYRIDRENIAIPDDNGITQQAGDQESRGVELELAAEPLPRLRTLLSYAHTDSELTRFARVDDATGTVVDLSGNDAPYAPEHLARLWISRRFESGFGVAGGARYFSAQFFNADNAYEVDGALLFDAALFYDLDAWRFRVNFKNLGDTEYETGSFASTSVVPGNPRTVYGSVDYRF